MISFTARGILLRLVWPHIRFFFFLNINCHFLLLSRLLCLSHQLDWRFEILDPALSGAEAAAGKSAADLGPTPEEALSNSDGSSSAATAAVAVYGSGGTVGGRLDMTLYRGPAPPPGVDGIEVQTSKHRSREVHKVFCFQII